MEWMLQVVDEMDDAIGAARHRWFGFHAALGALFRRAQRRVRP
jgi:hypothetical protein